MEVRQPVVAGQFYPADPRELTKLIEKCYSHEIGPGKLPKLEKGPRKIVAAMVPHAGYIYSGPVAAHTYSRVASDGKPDTFILIGPNHTGMGAAVAMMVEGRWKTPLGEVSINKELAEAIQGKTNVIERDRTAHFYEHSIEVQLPFLQHIFGAEFDFIPICMALQDEERSKKVADAITDRCKGEDVVVLATTDLTHYESYDSAKEKDQKAINAILELDTDALYSTIRKLDISMCGYGPTSVAIEAAKGLGAEKAELLKYATSGDVTGDKYQVVGYGAICFERQG